MSQTEEHLKTSRKILESTKKELMDYISGGRDRDTPQQQIEMTERLRWERDYWAFRVQSLQNDIELMKGRTGD